MVKEKITKKDIEGLTAIQTRMAMILLRVNGRDNAIEFIRKCKQETVGISV